MPVGDVRRNTRYDAAIADIRRDHRPGWRRTDIEDAIRLGREHALRGREADTAKTGRWRWSHRSIDELVRNDIERAAAAGAAVPAAPALPNWKAGRIKMVTAAALQRQQRRRIEGRGAETVAAVVEADRGLRPQREVIALGQDRL